VANHISGLDPLLLIAAARRPVRFLIAHEEYSRFGFTWIYRLAGCIPVERGRNPERAFKAALQALEKGEVVALFPEGGIHTRDAPAKHLKTGAIRLSYLADVPIYPAHIQGVRGEGSVFLAVLMRSRAVISHHVPIVCEKAHSKHCLDHIREIIQQPVGRL
jgi:1-acyl-sn-glycerol-3-phosphate acyltransferase